MFVSDKNVLQYWKILCFEMMVALFSLNS